MARTESPVLRRITKKAIKKTLLLEIAWEVLNQVGGIYTVIRSKVPTNIEKWQSNYCLVGPYMQENVTTEFEPIEESKDPFFNAVGRMREMGFNVYYGVWLVSGRPRVVLFDLGSIMPKLGEIKYQLWENHGITSPDNDFLLNDTLAFGELVRIYLTELSKSDFTRKKIIAHFHEWMSASGLLGLRRDNIPITTVFTTHATLLGRYLAMNDPQF